MTKIDNTDCSFTPLQFDQLIRFVCILILQLAKISEFKRQRKVLFYAVYCLLKMAGKPANWSDRHCYSSPVFCTF